MICLDAHKHTLPHLPLFSKVMRVHVQENVNSYAKIERAQAMPNAHPYFPDRIILIIKIKKLKVILQSVRAPPRRSTSLFYATSNV